MIFFFKVVDKNKIGVL